VIGLLLFALFNSSDVFLLLAIKDKGYSDTQMIGFYIFYNVVYALLSYPAGIVADKLGMRKTLLFGILMFVVTYSMFGFAGSSIFIGLLFLIYGIYASATEGISKALITNLCKQNETATAIGFYNSFLSVCALLASTIGGFIWFTFSPKVMFLFAGVGATVALVYFIIVFGKSNTKEYS
jgi:MFS family permease